jgi:surface protein
MSYMFYDAGKFNGNVELWNTGEVHYMDYMFYNASSFSNHDLRGWDVSNVTSHDDFLTGAGDNNIEPNWP